MDDRVLSLETKFRALGERFGWFDRPLLTTLEQLTQELEKRNTSEESLHLMPQGFQASDISSGNTHPESALGYHSDSPIVLDASSNEKYSGLILSPVSSEPISSPPQPKSLRERMLMKYNPEKSVGSDSDDLETFFSQHRTPIKPLHLSETPADDSANNNHCQGALDDFIVSDNECLSAEDSWSDDSEDDVFVVEKPSNKENVPATWLSASPRLPRKLPGQKKMGVLTTGGKRWHSPVSSKAKQRFTSVAPPRPRSVLQSVITPYSTEKDFKKSKDRLVRELFELYNTVVFENRLPSDFSITWNKKMRSTAGFCYYGRKAGINTARIELAEKVIDSADRLRDTLIHEMCHAAAWLISAVKAGHGPVWKKWAARANFVLQDLPPISRCHSYKINAKFTYVCTNDYCSNSIGRHSKSINIEKQRCGYCHSRLKLQPQLKKDGTPAQTRTPNKFALFVKENYSKVKREGMAHKDVMKELSSQFGTLNVK